MGVYGDGNYERFCFFDCGEEFLREFRNGNVRWLHQASKFLVNVIKEKDDVQRSGTRFSDVMSFSMSTDIALYSSIWTARIEILDFKNLQYISAMEYEEERRYRFYARCMSINISAIRKRK